MLHPCADLSKIFLTSVFRTINFLSKYKMTYVETPYWQYILALLHISEISSKIKAPGSPRALTISTVFIPVAVYLPRQRHNGIMRRLMSLYDCFSGRQFLWLQQQGHSTAQLPLNAPRSWRNAILHPCSIQQSMKSQPLLIILEENIPADPILRH